MKKRLIAAYLCGFVSPVVILFVFANVRFIRDGKRDFIFS